MSDKFTRINAIFDEEATQKVENEKRCRFTELRIGAFIVVESFEIITSHLAGSDRISLRVKTFEWHGEQGSPISNFPRDIKDVDKERWGFVYRKSRGDKSRLEKLRDQQKSSSRDVMLQQHALNLEVIQAHHQTSCSARKPDIVNGLGCTNQPSATPHLHPVSSNIQSSSLQAAAALISLPSQQNVVIGLEDKPNQPPITTAKLSPDHFKENRRDGVREDEPRPQEQFDSNRTLSLSPNAVKLNPKVVVYTSPKKPSGEKSNRFGDGAAGAHLVPTPPPVGKLQQHEAVERSAKRRKRNSQISVREVTIDKRQESLLDDSSCR